MRTQALFDAHTGNVPELFSTEKALLGMSD
jgi:hypothetical protein